MKKDFNKEQLLRLFSSPTCDVGDLALSTLLDLLNDELTIDDLIKEIHLMEDSTNAN